MALLALAKRASSDLAQVSVLPRATGAALALGTILAGTHSALAQVAGPLPLPTPDVWGPAQGGLQALTQTVQACQQGTSAMTSPTLANLTHAFTGPLDGFAHVAYTYARFLFITLAPIEIAWFFIHLLWRHGDLNHLLGNVAFKIISVVFFMGLLNFVGTSSFVTDMENGWITAGLSLSQGTTYNPNADTTPLLVDANNAETLPGKIVAQGVCTGMIVTVGPAMGMIQNITSGNLWNMAAGAGQLASFIGQGFLLSPLFVGMWLVQLALGLLVTLAFGIVALQVVITLIERAIITSTGIILLGFSATRWTMDWAQSYWRYMVHIGIKLFVVTVIANVGTAWFASLVAQESNGVASWVPIASLPTLFIETLAILLLLGMAIMLPTMIASYLSGTPTMGTGTLMTGLGSIAAVAGAIGTLTQTLRMAALPKMAGASLTAGEAPGQLVAAPARETHATGPLSPASTRDATPRADAARNTRSAPPTPPPTPAPAPIPVAQGAKAAARAGAGRQQGGEAPKAAPSARPAAAPQAAPEDEGAQPQAEPQSADTPQTQAAPHESDAFGALMQRLWEAQTQTSNALQLTTEQLERLSRDATQTPGRPSLSAAGQRLMAASREILRDAGHGGGVSIRMHHHENV
jgi:P-type conjugative transfer protein TrbL